MVNTYLLIFYTDVVGLNAAAVGTMFVGTKLALEEMKRYWGEMILDGADTFWGLYNPYNKHESPSSMLNSYCHAWSCTPTYLLRKFYKKKEKFRDLFV